MIRFLIYRPISVIVIYVALSLLALLSLQRIPISLLPDIDIPQVTILVEQSNYSAKEIETRVLKPLQQRLLQVDGIERMEAIASHESGIIRLKFIYGRDIDYAFLEVNEKIDQSLNSLPAEIDRPRVVKASAGELPAFYLSMTHQAEEESDKEAFFRLGTFADEVVRRRLEQLESVALVDLSGISTQQVVIQPKENLLINLGITQSDIQEALESANLTMGTIKVQERQYEYLVRLGQNLSSVQDIQGIALRIGERVFSLHEIAKVSLMERSLSGLYFFNNQRGVSLAVIKNSASRTEVLETDINEVLKELREQHPEISIHKSRDQLFLLNYSLINLRQSLLLGGCLAVMIVFFFYRNWRIPVIIAIVLPLSILLSLLFFDAFGLSINIISLSGLILGLGLMIDNGIIVLDNISQFVSEGKTIAEACLDGTNEMIRPLLSSMLTTCSVFLPLIFLSGISGALFYAQALAVTIGLTISYLVSISLLPVLYFALNKKKEGLISIKKQSHVLARFYEFGYRLTFRYPVTILGLAVLTIILGFIVAQRLPLRQLPAIPQTAFELYLDWNENIRPEVAQERISSLFASSSDTSLNYLTHIGQQQYLFNYDPLQKSSVVHFYVSARTEYQAKQTQENLVAKIREKFPLATYNFFPERTVFEQLFPSDETDLKIGLKIGANTTDARTLEKFRKLSTAFQHTFPKGEVVLPVMEDQVLLVPNRERLLFHELTSEQLFQELQRALSSRQLMVMNSFNSSIPLVISGPKSDLRQLLQTFQIKNEHEHWIPVHQLVHLEIVESLKNIYASENGAYLPLNLHGPSSEQQIVFLEQYERAHPETQFELSGTYFQNQELFKELLLVLGVSILLLYFIMAAQFESLIQPIIILLEVPVSLSGCVLFLYLGGATLNAMAFIGMVVTAGIIINDSIIKIDTINRLHQTGQYSILQAIHKGGLKRLNPIIMTSLTSILAVVPFLWGSDVGSSLQRPLALALIGGMICGTLVSLFLIPLIYSLVYKKKLPASPNSN